MAVIEAEVQVAEQQAAFDYAQIDEAVRDEVQAAARSIHQLERGVMTGLIAIGKRLIEVKDMLDHGQFTAWVEGEFGMQSRMAQNMMNVAREYGDAQKRNIISFFNPTVAYLLSAPSTPDEARTEVEQAAARGEKVTVEFAREAIRRAKPEPEPEMPRPLARAGYELVRARNGDTDKWGWQWQVDIPGSGDGLGKDGDRHIGPWVAQPLEAIQGATEHHEQRQAATRQGARAVYVEPAGAELMAQESKAEPHREPLQVFEIVPGIKVRGSGDTWRGDDTRDPRNRVHMTGFDLETTMRWARRQAGIYDQLPVADSDEVADEAAADEFDSPRNIALLEGQEYVAARLAQDEAQADAAPHTLPDDLAAAGFQLIQPKPNAWAILNEDGPIPFESNWVMEADIDVAIEEARAFLGENAYAAFEAWLAEGPREPSLRECLAVLEYAKRIVGRVRQLEPSLDALAGAILPPWSQLVNAVERKVKHGAA